MKNKLIKLGLVMGIIGISLTISNPVKAYSIDKIVKEGEFKAEFIKPSDEFDMANLLELTHMLDDYNNISGDLLHFDKCNDDLSKCNIVYKKDGVEVQTPVKMTYKTLDNSIIKKYKKVVNNINNHKGDFIIDDINSMSFKKSLTDDYYYDLIEILSLSENFKDITDSDFDYYYDSRLGGMKPFSVYSSGNLIIAYKGVYLGSIRIDKEDDIKYIQENNVIYISSNTENTKEAFLKAAKKKLKYFFKDVSIKVGGKIEDLIGKSLTDKEKNKYGEYYYVVSVNNGKEVTKYNYLICKDSKKGYIDINDANISKFKEEVAYTGKKITFNLNLKVKGTKLIEGTDYTLKYKDNKKLGTATVTIKGIGKYYGEVTKKFKILPKSTSISKITKKKKSFDISWKKQTNNTTGYQIEYSLNKDFSKSTKILIKKNTITSTSINKLKANKKYYVRIRTYKLVDGKKIYSNWSDTKTIKTK